MSILRQTLQQVATLPDKHQRDEVLLRLYPNFNRMYEQVRPIVSWGETDLPEKAVHIYGVKFYQPLVHTVRPMIFTEQTWHRLAALQGKKIEHRTDPTYAHKLNSTATATTIYTYMELEDWLTVDQPAYTHISVNYIPLPINPAVQDPTDYLDFEPLMADILLGKATLFGRVDSQDMMDLQQLAATLVT